MPSSGTLFGSVTAIGRPSASLTRGSATIRPDVATATGPSPSGIFRWPSSGTATTLTAAADNGVSGTCTVTVREANTLVLPAGTTVIASRAFAALSGVDPSLYEAAKIDGANALQRVIHVEFPVLVPTIMILLIMNMGNILNVGFDKIFLMQNTLNKSVSEVISTYVYHLMAPTTGAPQFSLATAVGLFTNVVNFAFLIATNYISKRVTGSGLM